MDTNMKFKKAGMDEGIMPIKSLRAVWRRGTFQKQCPMGTVHDSHEKKNSFCDGHQYEMRKSWDGGGNNACEVIVCWVEERNIINKQNILFVVVCSYNEKETTFSMKPKSQGRRWDSVKKKCKNFN